MSAYVDFDRHILDGRYSTSARLVECPDCREETLVQVETEFGHSYCDQDCCKHCGREFTGDEPEREDEPPEPEPPDFDDGPDDRDTW
jgi:hypothetical protein